MHTEPTPQETKELDLKVEISEKNIDNSIKGIAEKLNNNYKSIKNIILMCMLNGAKPFYDRLIQFITFPYIKDEMKISCYGNNTEASEPELKKTPTQTISNSNTIIIIDELIDSGVTLNAAKHYLANFTDKLTTVVLFNRNIKRTFNANIYGMEISFPADRFLIGFGLDLKGKYRNFKNVYSMQKPSQPVLSTELQPQITQYTKPDENKASNPEKTYTPTFN